MIRLVHLVDRLHLGGAERMAVELAGAMDPARYRVTICISRSGNLMRSEIPPHVEVIELGRTRKWDLRALVKFARYTRREKIDVLHAHGLGSFHFALAAKLFGLRAKLLLHDHDVPGGAKVISGDGKARRRVWYSLIFRIGRPWYVAVDENVFQWSRSAGAASARSRAIPNALNLDRFSAAWSKQRERTWGTGRLEGVCVATVRPAKDFETLIDAVSKLANKTCSISVIGTQADADYLRRCEALIEARGLSARIKFIGPSDNVAQHLAAADFAVSSSQHESGPLVLIEYMAAGLPFVATRTGQVAETAATFGVEEFVPPRDADAFAAALDRLLSLSASYRKTRVEKGREVAGIHFDIASQVPAWDAVYSRMIA